MIKKIRDELLQTVSHLSNDEIQSLRTDYFSAMKSTELKKNIKLLHISFHWENVIMFFP